MKCQTNNRYEMPTEVHEKLFKSAAKIKERRHSWSKKILQLIWTQPVFACSKLKIESLEQGVKHVQN